MPEPRQIATAPRVGGYVFRRTRGDVCLVAEVEAEWGMDGKRHMVVRSFGPGGGLERAHYDDCFPVDQPTGGTP
jgi:hypothetical protein